MGKGLSSPVYPGSRNKAEGLARLLWFLCKGLGLAGPKAGGEAAGPRAGMSSTAKWIRPGLAVICFHYWARLVIL